MGIFSQLPEMKLELAPEVDNALPSTAAGKEISAMDLRCGGCGVKVGSQKGLLASVLPEKTEDCVQELVRLYYSHTAIVGEVSAVAISNLIEKITRVAK